MRDNFWPSLGKKISGLKADNVAFATSSKLSVPSKLPIRCIKSSSTLGLLLVLKGFHFLNSINQSIPKIDTSLLHVQLYD